MRIFFSLFFLSNILFANSQNISINPQYGFQDQNIGFVISGNGTNFLSDSTYCGNVTEIFFNSATRNTFSTADFSIINDSTIVGTLALSAFNLPGNYSVFIYINTNQNCVIECEDCFTLLPNGSIEIEPSYAFQGDSLEIEVTGDQTFFGGVSQLCFADESQFFFSPYNVNAVLPGNNFNVTTNELYTFTLNVPENAETGTMNFSGCEYNCEACFAILQKDELVSGNENYAQNESYLIQTSAYNFNFNCNIDFNTLLFVHESGFGFSPDNAVLRGTGNLEMSGNVPEFAPLGLYDIVYDQNDAECSIFCSACFEVVAYNNLNELENTTQLNVFPNPSNGIFTVESNALKNNSKILIFNSLGKVVEAKNLHSTTKTEIDLTQFKAGIYLLKISNNFKTISKKIILQK